MCPGTLAAMTSNHGGLRLNINSNLRPSSITTPCLALFFINDGRRILLYPNTMTNAFFLLSWLCFLIVRRSCRSLDHVPKEGSEGRKRYQSLLFLMGFFESLPHFEICDGCFWKEIGALCWLGHLMQMAYKYLWSGVALLIYPYAHDLLVLVIEQYEWDVPIYSRDCVDAPILIKKFGAYWDTVAHYSLSHERIWRFRLHN